MVGFVPVSALVQWGVKVRLFTKPAGGLTGSMVLHADVVMGQLRAAGVAVQAVDNEAAFPRPRRWSSLVMPRHVRHGSFYVGNAARLGL